MCCFDTFPAGHEGGAHRCPYLTENGAEYGRPYAIPAVTVCTGLSHALPLRVLLRVSTNDTGASTSSMMATSPGAPTWSVPSFGARLMSFAGAIVAMATTCSTV